MSTRSLKKSVMLFSAVMAVCAMPSAASAASWGVIGSAHTLTSTSMVFVAHLSPTAVQVNCSHYQFNIDVSSAAALRVTSATFNCTGGSPNVAGCSATMTATGLPWTITGTTTSDVTIDGYHADVRFEDKPGTPGECNPTFPDITFSGRVGGGVWNGGAGAHTITYTNATGLSATGFHSGGGQVTVPATLSGTLRDLAQTLTLT
jgi:hypothetical protein